MIKYDIVYVYKILNISFFHPPHRKNKGIPHERFFQQTAAFITSPSSPLPLKDFTPQEIVPWPGTTSQTLSEGWVETCDFPLGLSIVIDIHKMGWTVIFFYLELNIHTQLFGYIPGLVISSTKKHNTLRRTQSMVLTPYRPRESQVAGRPTVQKHSNIF